MANYKSSLIGHAGEAVTGANLQFLRLAVAGRVRRAKVKRLLSYSAAGRPARRCGVTSGQRAQGTLAFDARGIGHSSYRMYSSVCGPAELFDKPGCDSASE
jgi:hypothetical protein